MDSRTSGGFQADHDMDFSMATDAELEAILMDARALGLPLTETEGGAFESPSSHIAQPGLFQDADADAMLNDLQNQLLALQPQSSSSSGGSSSSSAGKNAGAAVPSFALQAPSPPDAAYPQQFGSVNTQGTFLTPPRQSYGASSGGNNAQAQQLALLQQGGFWTGKLSTPQGPFASVVARMLITKERPAVAIEDYSLRSWPASLNLQIASFHAVNSSELQLLFARSQCPLLELVPNFQDPSLPPFGDGSVPAQRMWEQFQSEMTEARLIGIVPFPTTAPGRPLEGLVLFAQPPNRIFAGAFVGPRFSPLPQLMGPSVMLNFQQQQQRLLSAANLAKKKAATLSMTGTDILTSPTTNSPVRKSPGLSAIGGAVAPPSLTMDQELEFVIQRWPTLSYEGKQAILAVARSATAPRADSY